MTKSRKIRAFQMAKDLGLSFKEFQTQAESVGVTFSSAQVSLEESEALHLLETLRALTDATPSSSESTPTTPTAASVETNSTEHKSGKETSNKNSSVVKETHATKEISVSADTSSKSVDKTDTPKAESTKTDSSVGAKESPSSVELICHHSHTFPGDRVFVCGSLPELGQWEPEKALELDAQTWPDWKALLKLPKDTSFEFKLLLKNEHGYFWENGENRSYTVSDNNTIEIESFR